MERIHAWYERLCPASAVDDLSHLTHAGIELVPIGPQVERGPGLVFFSEITQAVYDAVGALSRNGLERVFAISTSRTALTGSGSWRLLQAGAADVVVWDHTTRVAHRIAARLQHWHQVDQLVVSPTVRGTLVGESPAWRRVLRQIVEVALTRSSVLITGETGTGKELVAKVLHALDPRAAKSDLHVLDCTTIVPDLAGSELFGHERGAFTHAVTARDGAFALADGGTLFLDEVGELPAGLQAQLLRVVQERTFKRVGGNTWYHTDFRLVCATNRDLRELVRQGLFRADLYYRLASWTIRLPALRERGDDILRLAEWFIQRRLPDKAAQEVDDVVREYLLTREYPGNVRDLKQVASRIMDRHVGTGHVSVGDIPEDERPSCDVDVPAVDWRGEAFARVIRHAVRSGIGLKDIRRAAEDVAIEIAVEDESGNLPRAARQLKVTGRALQIRAAASRRIRSRAG
jgi:transcriptional regulator with GAF, ATPase, and Fis domain